jgi:hypothetical protein
MSCPAAADALADNDRALDYYVNSHGQLSPQQCLRLAEEDTFALERQRPWTRWAYLVIGAATLALSTLHPWGFAS